MKKTEFIGVKMDIDMRNRLEDEVKQTGMFENTSHLIRFIIILY